MRSNMKYLLLLSLVMAIALCISLTGCDSSSDSTSNSDQGNANSLENLKSRAATVTEYSCDFNRHFGSEIIEGRLLYKDENIRFEMFGITPEDTTVTIVNQEKNQTYTYNRKMGKGQVDEPAAFLLDVPLPGEIMSVLTTDNCSFTGQSERDGLKCTAFKATDVQFFGFKFTGDIVVANESGLPVYVSGQREEIPVVYEYKNYSTATLPAQEFSAPGDIDFH